MEQIKKINEFREIGGSQADQSEKLFILSAKNLISSKAGVKHMETFEKYLKDLNQQGV